MTQACFSSEAGRSLSYASVNRGGWYCIRWMGIRLLPQHVTRVRTVEILGLDLQADGGTHVANTCEVGPIRVVGHESKGRINKRLRVELEP